MRRRPAGGERPANPPLLAALRADARELSKVKAADRGAVGIVDALMLPGFWSGALWRVGNALHDRKIRPLSRLCYITNMILFGADLASGASVGPGLVMPHPVGVAIASDVVIGSRCRIMGLVRIGGSGKGGRGGHPVLGDDVWVLDGGKIFGPVEVGSQSVVGASAMVTRDVPPRMLVLPPRETTELRMRPRTDLETVPAEASEVPAEPVAS
ncbi:MAG: serine acetyltransferase [Humibacillus sp.]|nr:serine acetyltransferase [Humibacillus sp.]